MQTVVNLYCMKVNSISGNGSITIGEAVHNSHTSNNKSQGINSSYGDTSPTEAMMENAYIDPDVNDQTAVANADTANVGAPLPVPVPVPIDAREEEKEKEDPDALSNQHIQY